MGEVVTGDGLSDEAAGLSAGAEEGEVQAAVTASAAPTAHVASARTRGRAQSQCTRGL